MVLFLVVVYIVIFFFLFFFFNDTATTEIYTLSLHDALPVLRGALGPSHGEVDRALQHAHSPRVPLGCAAPAGRAGARRRGRRRRQRHGRTEHRDVLASVPLQSRRLAGDAAPHHSGAGLRGARRILPDFFAGRRERFARDAGPDGLRDAFVQYGPAVHPSVLQPGRVGFGAGECPWRSKRRAARPLHAVRARCSGSPVGRAHRKARVAGANAQIRTGVRAPGSKRACGRQHSSPPSRCPTVRTRAMAESDGEETSAAGVRVAGVVRWALIALMAAAAVGAWIGYARAESRFAPSADPYQCPMHPSVVLDRPGECAICGMALVPVAHAPKRQPGGPVPGLVRVDIGPERTQLVGMRT